MNESVSAEGSSNEDAHTVGFLGARTATIVLGSLLACLSVDGMIALIEYLLIDEQNGVFPSFSARAVLTITGQFVGISGLLLAVRFAGRDVRRIPQRPQSSIPMLLLILFVVIMAVGGVAASIHFPQNTATAIGESLPVSRLVEWNQQTIRLALIAITTKTAGLIGAFLYGAYEWWSATRERK